MRQSGRGQDDPFILMEGMEAAARAGAADRRIIPMEIGQPSTVAPAAARKAEALDFAPVRGARTLRFSCVGSTSGIEASHDHLVAFMAGR